MAAILEKEEYHQSIDDFLFDNIIEKRKAYRLNGYPGSLYMDSDASAADPTRRDLFRQTVAQLIAAGTDINHQTTRQDLFRGFVYGAPIYQKGSIYSGGPQGTVLHALCRFLPHRETSAQLLRILVQKFHPDTTILSGGLTPAEVLATAVYHPSHEETMEMALSTFENLREEREPEPMANHGNKPDTVYMVVTIR